MMSPEHYNKRTFEKIQKTLRDDRVYFGCDDKGDICGFIDLVRLQMRIRIILRKDGFMIDRFLEPPSKMRVLEYLNEYFGSFRFVGDNHFIQVIC